MLSNAIVKKMKVKRVLLLLCCSAYAALGSAAMNDFIDFQQLSLPTSPNYALACPADYCQGKAMLAVPIFAINKADLESITKEIMTQQPRTEFIKGSSKQVIYVQRSYVFAFKDFIHIEFLPLGAQQSSVMILSRAQTGYYDFGVNKRRVQQLVEAIAAQVEVYTNTPR